MIKPTNYVLVIFILFLILFVCFILPKQTEQKKQKENKVHTPLTIEKLRTYKGLEGVTDAEAENIIYSLNKYAEITFSLFHEEKINRNS